MTQPEADTTAPPPAPPEGDRQTLRGTNQSGMRAYNERLVLSLVRRHGVLVKTEIARMTGLSAQTISVIMRGLEADQLLTRGEPIRGKVGQPSVPMSINPDGAYFLGLKVGRRSADLVLIDFLGRPRKTIHMAYAYPHPHGITRFVSESAREIVEELSPEARARVAGLGIATPFKLWDWHGAFGAPQADMDLWRDFDLRREVASLCAYPVYLENDATAACAAELAFGTHAGRQNFLYLYVGTFIGGGVVLNGSVYSGPTGNAGAMGSMPVPGPEGKAVQLLDRASILLLERMMQTAGADPSILWRTPDDWSAAANLVEGWLDTVAAALAHAVVSAISIIDFEAVVIDGAMPEQVRAGLVEKIRAAILRLDLEGLDLPEIVEGGIGLMARALGAASLPLFDRFLIDQHTLMRERLS